MLQLPRGLRVLVVCVMSLLAANAAVVVTRLGDGAAAAGTTIVAPPTVEVQDTIVRDVAIITTADGHVVAVDPSTPEGQAAIADAIARGDDVETRTVAVPAPDGAASNEPGVAGADADGSSSAADGSPLSRAVLEAVVADVAREVSATGASPTTPPVGGGDDASSPVDDLLDAVDGVVDDVVEDVTELVDDITDGTTVSVPGVPVTVTTPPVTVPSVTVPPVTVTVTVPPVTVSTPPVTVSVPVVTTVVTVPSVTVTLPPVTIPPVTLPPATVPTTLPPIGGPFG